MSGHWRQSWGYWTRNQRGRGRESTHAVWLVCSYGYGGVLRPRESWPLVHFGVRGGMCARLDLRLSPRSLAVWAGGGCLVHCGGAAMVACCGTIRLNDYRARTFVASRQTVIWTFG